MRYRFHELDFPSLDPIAARIQWSEIARDRAQVREHGRTIGVRDPELLAASNRIWLEILSLTRTAEKQAKRKS